MYIKQRSALYQPAVLFGSLSANREICSIYNNTELGKPYYTHNADHADRRVVTNVFDLKAMSVSLEGNAKAMLISTLTETDLFHIP